MTKEEQAQYISKKLMENPEFRKTFVGAITDAINVVVKAINALEQEPCDDEYIKVPKKALKYRTAGMVAYNVEWLKHHFDIERAVICGAQEPCDDAISRQAVLDLAKFDGRKNLGSIIHAFDVERLQPVTPAEKVGQWIVKGESWYCSRCNEPICEIYDGKPYEEYCPNCGAKMQEGKE